MKALSAMIIAMIFLKNWFQTVAGIYVLMLMLLCACDNIWVNIYMITCEYISKLYENLMLHEWVLLSMFAAVFCYDENLNILTVFQ